MTKPPCDQCKGLCCQYITVPIQRPNTRGDFDDLRWYLAHENIIIYVEDDIWYMQVNNRCRHLDKDFQCDIYKQRPQVCRDYGDSCELCEEDYEYELLFRNDAEMQAYMDVRFNNAKEQSDRQRKRGRRRTQHGRKASRDRNAKRH